MVKNRTELLEMANHFVKAAKDDIKSKINEIIDEFETNEDEIAYALGVEKSEIDKVMRGDGDILISTLAKVLISTDHVVEIKPLSAVPEEIRKELGLGEPIPTEERIDAFSPIELEGSDEFIDEFEEEDFNDDEETEDNPFVGEPVGEGVRKVAFSFGEMFINSDGKPCDKYGNVLPPPPGIGTLDHPTSVTEAPVFETHTTTEGVTPRETRRPTPTRDSHGRFVSTGERQLPPEEYYARLATERLKRIITRNHWTDEIDVDNATRRELINFISAKERRMSESETECEHRPETPRCEATHHHCDKIDEMLENLKNDENLKKAFKGLLSALLD
jgi:predicted XRE-type DNA-binding protein